jgi:hypothetical protein
MSVRYERHEHRSACKSRNVQKVVEDTSYALVSRRGLKLRRIARLFGLFLQFRNLSQPIDSRTRDRAPNDRDFHLSDAMLQLRLPRWQRATTLVRADDFARLGHWFGWLVCVALLVGSLSGRVRMTGLVIALAITMVMRLAGWLSNAHTKRVFIGLTIAIALVVLARQARVSWLDSRVVRVVVSVGLTAAAWQLRPPPFRSGWRALHDQLATAPNGSLAMTIAALLVVAPVVSVQLCTTNHVGIYDTLPVIATVVQELEHNTRDLTHYTHLEQSWRWKAYPAGESYYFAATVPTQPGLYSCYPAGMEVFAWPVVLSAKAMKIDLYDEWQQHWLERITAAVISAISLGLFFLTALHFGSPLGAYFTTLLLATGSVFASTLGMLLWQQAGIVFWSLIILCIEVRSAGQPSRWGTLVQGIACGMMLACRPSAVTFLVPFGVWMLMRNWRRGVAIPFVAALAYAPWAWLYWRIYGTILGPSLKLAQSEWSVGEYLPGVLFSPSRGLFVYQPWVWLLVAWLVIRVQQLPTAFQWNGFWAFITLMLSGHLLLIGSWPMWWGGHCYGSRLLAELVPVLGLLVVPIVTSLLSDRRAWPLLAALLIVGCLIHVPCQFSDAWKWNAIPTNIDDHPERLWDWAHPPFLHGQHE